MNSCSQPFLYCCSYTMWPQRCLSKHAIPHIYIPSTSSLKRQSTPVVWTTKPTTMEHQNMNPRQTKLETTTICGTQCSSNNHLSLLLEKAKLHQVQSNIVTIKIHHRSCEVTKKEQVHQDRRQLIITCQQTSMLRVRTILTFGYWVLPNIFQYWVVLGIGQYFYWLSYPIPILLGHLDTSCQ